MDKLPSSFGVTIAFLFPGFLALGAASYFIPVVQGWLVRGDAGGAVLAVLMAAGAGAFVSHVRSFIDDQVLKRHQDSTKLNHDARREPGKEATFQALLANHYHFYLFATNTATAGWMLFTAWWWATRPAWGTWGMALFALVVATRVLVSTGNRARALFDVKAKQLLGLAPTPQQGKAA